jgi:hypothetical protein
MMTIDDLARKMYEMLKLLCTNKIYELSNAKIKFLIPLNYLVPESPNVTPIYALQFMKKTALLLWIVLSSVIIGRAQGVQVSGIITDKQNNSLPGAGIVLLNASDSVFVSGGQADANGNFVIQKVNPGKYIIKISYVGYNNLFINKVIGTQPVVMGKLVLIDKQALLEGVNVNEKMPTTQLKGDTTQFNAQAFKTNPDATAEDLVNKMPGISSQNNKVQAQNEDVKQVLVNGKPFFGDDPNAVLKNIPAEIIDKIQVYDEKSDQSQFTGFDDGNTSKTINIITKTHFQNGTFGKVYGGYGYEDKWKGGFNLNFFKNNRRLSIIGQTNNINDQNFTTEDLLGVMSSGGGSRGSGRPTGGRGGSSPQYGQDNSSNNFLVDQKGGVTTTNSFGINYVNKWKKVDFTGSYFLNYTDNNINSNLVRQYITGSDANLVYNEKNTSSSINVNHRANLKFDWKIDSLNSILFRPKLSLQQNNGSSTLLGVNNQSGIVTGSTENDYNSKLIGINFSAPLLYRHSFRKERRTFSISITPGYNESIGKSYLKSFTQFQSDTLAADTLNQLANLNKQGIVASASITYTEPISKKSQLLFSYGGNYNKTSSDKETYDFLPVQDTYSIFDTTLSNKFNTTYFAQSLGTSFRYQSLKWSFNAGITVQEAQLTNKQQFPYDYDLERTFYSILPNAMLQFKFSAKKNLRIFYRSTNDAPSVTQLQNVVNNTNPLQLSSGNPDLRQDWQNSLNIRYSAINTVKSTAFFVLLSGNYTQNYITDQTVIAAHDSAVSPGIILTRGSQFTKPVNLDGYYSIRSFVNYSFTIPKIKCNLSFNFGGSYSSTPGLINNDKNRANTASPSLGIVISSNISEKVDFTLSSNSAYNITSNTLQSRLNSSYLNQNTRFKIQLMPWKGLVLQTDLSHQYYKGLSQNYNQNYLLWNAAIGYKFLKNKAAEFRLSIYDILKQNNSITRNITDTYYEDVQTNVLQRYLMLTFTYNIKNFNTTGSAEHNSSYGTKHHDDGS